MFIDKNQVVHIIVKIHQFFRYLLTENNNRSPNIYSEKNSYTKRFDALIEHSTKEKRNIVIYIYKVIVRCYVYYLICEVCRIYNVLVVFQSWGTVSNRLYKVYNQKYTSRNHEVKGNIKIAFTIVLQRYKDFK